MRWMTVVLAAAAMATAHAGPADEPDCTQPQHAQRLINHCSSLAAEAADAKLTALYEKVAAAIHDAADRGRFKAAEEAFVAYRDAQCTFEAPPSRRGSMWSMVYTSCKRALTETRLAELKRLDCRYGPDPDKCD